LKTILSKTHFRQETIFDLVSASILLEFFAVKVTVYFSALLYVCTRSSLVEEVLSPKFYGTPVIVAIKASLRIVE
jgi:hypothetical protein